MKSASNGRSVPPASNSLYHKYSIAFRLLGHDTRHNMKYYPVYTLPPLITTPLTPTSTIFTISTFNHYTSTSVLVATHAILIYSTLCILRHTTTTSPPSPPLPPAPPPPPPLPTPALPAQSTPEPPVRRLKHYLCHPLHLLATLFDTHHHHQYSHTHGSTYLHYLVPTSATLDSS